MSKLRRSTRRSNVSLGFSTVELLMAIALTTIAVATTSTFVSVGSRTVRHEALEIETTQAARAAVDVIVRELRLSGACLPVTGSFISLEATNADKEDQLVTRTGLTGQDLSCVRTATPIGSVTTADGTTIPVESTDEFSAGMRGYIRGPTTGEFFDITGVDTENGVLTRGASLSQDYPEGSGVYAVDERRFYIEHWSAPWGDTPELMMQVGAETPQPFAVGIEELNVEYELDRNCPSCDVLPLPSGDQEWRLVKQVFITVTARSDKPDPNGSHYRRTLRVGVKPRNLIPQ